MKLLTIDEVCDVLRIKRRHLQNIRKYDTFPKPVYVGKNKVRFKEADIFEFIQSGGLA